MAKTSVHFKGLDVLQAGLKERASMDDVKKVVAMDGAELTQRAKQNTPVKTGDLRGSIAQDISSDGLTSTTAPHVDYGPYVEVGTRFMVGRFYLKQAYDTEAPQFVNDLKKLTK